MCLLSDLDKVAGHQKGLKSQWLIFVGVRLGWHFFVTRLVLCRCVGTTFILMKRSLALSNDSLVVGNEAL